MSRLFSGWSVENTTLLLMTRGLGLLGPAGACTPSVNALKVERIRGVPAAPAFCNADGSQVLFKQPTLYKHCQCCACNGWIFSLPQCAGTWCGAWSWHGVL
jgi:hypothetical protein